jgi:hypothetical protein
LEASLHNLLTTARLTRVLTHCTWEKTTVAISKCGSKVGQYASSLCCPLLSCMVTVREESEASGFVRGFYFSEERIGVF